MTTLPPVKDMQAEIDPNSDLGYLLFDESPEAVQAWIEKYLTVPNELGQTVRMKLYPQQIMMLHDETGRDVTVKGRQTRASSLKVARNLRRLVTGQLWGATAVVGAQDNATTQGPSFRKRVVHHMRDLTAAGFNFGECIDNDQEFVIKDMDNRIAWVSGEQRTMSRGFAAQIVHLSEFAHWKESALELIGGVIPAVPSYPFGSIDLESTPKGEQGAFYDYAVKQSQLSMADPIWTVHLYEWWNEPRYTVSDNRLSGIDKILTRAELAQRENDFTPTDYEDRLMTKHGLNVRQILWRRIVKPAQDATLAPFLQEYPEDLDTCWLGVEGKYFDTADGVDHLEWYRDHRENPRKHFTKLEYRGADVPFFGPNFAVWTSPDQNDTYVIGFDAAGGGVGDKSDWSVAYVMSVRSETIVARIRCQASPKTFAAMLAAVGTMYHRALINGEREARGQVIFEELRDLGYNNIYYHVDPYKPLAKAERPQAGMYPNVANRQAVLEKMKTAVVSGALNSFCPELIREMNMFTWQKFQNRMKAAAMDAVGNHDDCIFAAAYTWYIIDKARNRMRRNTNLYESEMIVSGPNNMVTRRGNEQVNIPRGSQIWFT